MYIQCEDTNTLYMYLNTNSCFLSTTYFGFTSNNRFETMITHETFRKFCEAAVMYMYYLHVIMFKKLSHLFQKCVPPI